MLLVRCAPLWYFSRAWSSNSANPPAAAIAALHPGPARFLHRSMRLRSVLLEGSEPAVQDLGSRSAGVVTWESGSVVKLLPAALTALSLEVDADQQRHPEAIGAGVLRAGESAIHRPRSSAVRHGTSVGAKDHSLRLRSGRAMTPPLFFALFDIRQTWKCHANALLSRYRVLRASGAGDSPASRARRNGLPHAGADSRNRRFQQPSSGAGPYGLGS
jgi:hypothetical protein